MPNLSEGPWRGQMLAGKTGAVTCAPGANPSGLRLLGCWLAMQQQPHCLQAQWVPDLQQGLLLVPDAALICVNRLRSVLLGTRSNVCDGGAVLT